MTRKSIVIIMIILITVSGLYAEGIKRGEAPAVCVEKGPAVDGTMKDPIWTKAPKWALGRIISEKLFKYETYVRVLFDPTHIYIGFYCAEPDTENMPIAADARDGDVWKDDAVEIFLHADPEQPYYQFTVNPKGILYDGKNKDKSWNGTPEIKISIDENKSWTATVRISLREISAYVGEDQTWTMNFYRTRQKRGEDPLMEYSWAVMTSPKFHSPREFGVVRGVRVSKRDDGVTRIRKTPAPKPKTFNKGTDLDGITVYHKYDFDKELKDWSGSAKAKMSLIELAKRIGQEAPASAQVGAAPIG